MPNDAPFNDQVRQAQHATKIREERLIREKTGLSESQIRRAGLRDFFRDVLQNFNARTPHRHGTVSHAKVERRQQKVEPKPHAKSTGSTAPAGGGGVFTFIVNDSGTQQTITVRTQ